MIIEFRYEDNGDLLEYRTERWKIKLETDFGIEDYNKIYINLNSAISLEYAEAKVTTPKGEVKTIGQDQMIEEKNFEEYGRFKFFALEGLEIGSMVEFESTTKKYPSYNGSRYIMQEDVPVYNFHFHLLCPENLIFNFNALNGASNLARDSSDTLRNHWSSVEAFLPGYKDETYSNLRPSLYMVYYKLDENTASNKHDISSYKWAAQNVYSRLYPGLDKGVVKEFDKLGKSLKLAKMTDEEKIKAIELYVKKNIFIIEDVQDEKLRDLPSILSNKMADELGMTKLFVNWFEHLSINHQPLLTCDRFDQRFDPDYESYSFLQEYLIYFPELDNYMAPTYRLFRYGLIPYDFTATYGMFIKSVKVGEMASGVPLVKWIAPSDFRQSIDSTIYKIQLSDLENPRIVVNKYLTGYESAYLHGNMVHFSEDQLKEIEEAMIKNIRDDEELIFVETENTDEDLVGIRPLVFKGEIQYPNLISVANDNYLVNIGAIIGLQVELYQQFNRVNQVEMEFNHAYDRTIIMDIPDGYEVKNLETLKFDNRFEIDGKEKMAFVSSYEVKEGKLYFHNVEYYNEIFVDKKYFEEFKSVINAAADFNKAVVILSKIQP
jgi:hypothetical protein